MSALNRNITIIASVILILLIAAYANHFNNGFHFDDAHAIVENAHIRSISNIPSFFTDPKMFSNDPLHWGMRPLVTTTLAVDYWLAGNALNPFYFQLDTFLWFTLLCVMLYFMYKKLLAGSFNQGQAAYPAIIAAGWYALHTANAETVNYIISRSDVLSTFCIVTSFLIYISYPGKRKYFFYVVPAVIGVLAKETVLVLVILLFFYIILFEKKLAIADLFKAANFKSVINAVVKVLPLLLAVAAVQAYTLLKTNSIPGISNPLFYYLLTQSYVWLHYFIAFFLPFNLSADTDWTIIHNVFDERIILGLLFIAALIFIILKTSKNAAARPICFGLIWFAAALLPTSLAPFAEVTNDHRMFFPFIGLALSVVTAISLWLTKNQLAFNKYRTLIITCVLLVFISNAYGVYRRNQVWQTEETLWLDVTQKSPLNGRGLMNYGLTQMQKGNYQLADAYFTRALTYLPYYNTLYINMGILKGAMGKPAEAKENFGKAIGLSPDTFDSYAYYARYLIQINENATALAMAQKAVQINPYSAIGLHALITACSRLNLNHQLQRAVAQTLVVLPGDDLAKGYLNNPNQHQTINLTATLPVKNTLTADDYVNKSLNYYNQQQYRQCIEACQQAIHLAPNNADAYNNMGAAYNQLKQWDKAVAACTKALQLNPKHPLAAGNLNWAKNQKR